MDSNRSLDKATSGTLPENDFVERIPTRLGALAGLLVGVISSVVAKADIWYTLTELAIAFAIFAALGMVLRSLLVQASTKAPARREGPRIDSSDQSAQADQSSAARKPIVILPEDMEEYELRS